MHSGSYNLVMDLHVSAEGLSQSPGGLAGGRDLFNISLDWRGAGLHTIMGLSGSGKSSLLKTLAGVWKAQRGRVAIEGHDLFSDTGREQIQPRMGYAFQNNALFNSLSNFENLAFPHRLRSPKMPESQRKELVLSWLAKVDLEKSAALFPHELSGGMQKRLGIARALILEPDYIFLDDPTAGLDPITSRQIADLLGSLLKDRAALSVVVTNDFDRASQWGGHLHFLSDGLLISSPQPAWFKIQKEFQ